MITIVTYNTLAQRYVDLHIRTGYPHISDLDILTWDHRLKLIREKISNHNPDVICLQEVELKTITEDFVTYFAAYDSHAHSIRKKRTNQIGNIILWKKSFNAANLDFNSCGVFVTISDPNGQCIRIGNIHLKAGNMSHETDRVNQLVSCINKFGKNPGIICGDFNDELEPERSLKKIFDQNKFILDVNYPTCYAFDLTYPYEYWAFDHVVSFNTHVETFECALREKIPNGTEPSDHILVPFKVRLQKL